MTYTKNMFSLAELAEFKKRNNNLASFIFSYISLPFQLLVLFSLCASIAAFHSSRGVSEPLRHHYSL